MLSYYKYSFSIGSLYICANEKAITHVKTGEPPSHLQLTYEETDLIKECAKEIREYLDKKRKKFNVPIELEGTLFQKAVWQALINIGYGKVKTYKEIAIEANSPRGFRAVGNACNKNPILIIVPCHRVVGADKSLTGFACGLDVKQQLLDIEGIRL